MTDFDLIKAVQQAIQQSVEVIINEEADEAGKRVAKRVRAKTAEISTRLLDHFHMDMRGPELRIRIDLENFPKL